MKVDTITAAPFHPVTLAECYLHLRLDPEDSPVTHPDDDMLNRHIASATDDCEKRTHRSFVERTLRLHTADFCRPIDLIGGPVRAVNSVRYYDGANQLQTLDPSSYYVTDDAVPQVRFVTAFASPSIYERPDAVRVDYVAGYAPEGSPATTQGEYAANVPSQLKDAILLGVQLLYDSLSPEQRKNIERAQESLLSGFVLPFVA